MSFARFIGLTLAVALAIPASAHLASAQNRIVEVSFIPTERAQIAIWIERADGTFVRTLRLTEAVALRGIGNRPGALQMNSGFHWPYGRREGVLPIWAHRRAAAGEPFRRVIFQDRSSEGYASRTSNDASQDDYFCLSFSNDASSRDSLDATTCPSRFNSDKGRYLTEDDVRAGYAEPFEDEGGASSAMRAMDTTSVYPPRRDLPGVRGSDHEDAGTYVADSLAVMPELDAITMATLPAEMRRTIQVVLPADFEDGDYKILLEVNVEGDYAEAWDPERFPTPMVGGSGSWDFWAISYGYPYRGQPSVLFEVPFRVGNAGGTWQTSDPVGYGDIHGLSGEVQDMDGSITDDPETRPGSGADRLQEDPRGRVEVHVVPTNVCTGDDPPPQCFTECDATRPCDEGFVCNATSECVGICDVVMAPESLGALELTLDEERSWEYAHVAFVAPISAREVTSYQIRVGTVPFEAGMEFASWGVEAKVASLEQEALVLPTGQAPGTRIEADLGHLMPQTHYYVGVRATDECGAPSPVAIAEIETTEIIFTTVSPCFVATAAYGSPMASEIGALRRFRDRHLMNNAVGRGLVALYYDLGPSAADQIREDDSARSVVRHILAPIVSFVSWLDG